MRWTTSLHYVLAATREDTLHTPIDIENASTLVTFVEAGRMDTLWAQSCWDFLSLRAIAYLVQSSVCLIAAPYPVMWFTAGEVLARL